jgi:hypothetical protein
MNSPAPPPETSAMEILPCPWCRSNVGESIVIGFTRRETEQRVECECGSAGPFEDSYAHAVAEWNSIAALRKDLAEARAKLAEATSWIRATCCHDFDESGTCEWCGMSTLRGEQKETPDG